MVDECLVEVSNIYMSSSYTIYRNIIQLQLENISSFSAS